MSATTAGLGDAAARGTAVTMAGQAARVVIQFLATIVLARLLAPEDFGLVAMVAAVIGIAEMLRDFGLSSAAIQAKDVSDDERTNLFWVNTGLGVLLSGAVVLCSPLIAMLYGDPRLVWIAIALSSGFVLSGITTQFRADLTRELRFRALTALDVAGVACGLAAGITGAALGLSYWAIVVQQLTTTAVICVLSVVLTRWRPGLPKPHVSIRRFLRFGLGLLGTQSISYVTRNVDNVAIGAVWGAAPLGLYDRGYQLLMTPLNQINAPMTRVALPVLSRVHEDRELFARYLRKAQLVGCYLTASVFAVAAGLAEPVVLVLFGDRWLGVAPIFAVLAIGGVFRSLAQISYWIYLATGQTAAQLRMFLVLRPIMVLIILAGLPWGPIGVAAGSTVAYFLHWVVSLWRVGVVTGVDTRPLFANAIRTVLVISLPCGALAWCASLVPTAAPVQLLLGLAAAAAYVSLVALVLRPVREDLGVIAAFVLRMTRNRFTEGASRDAASKRALADQLVAAAPYARTGRWRIPTGSVAFHSGRAGRTAHSAWRKAVGRPRSLRVRAIRARMRWVAPRTVGVPAAAAVRSASEVRTTKEQGLILFDSEARQVVHVRRQPFPVGYEQRRARLSAWFPNPEWELRDHRSVLVERMASGTELARVAPAVRTATARDVLRACAAAAEGASGNSIQLVDAALGAALGAGGVPMRIRQQVEQRAEALRAGSARWGLSLSHGDLTGLNVLVEHPAEWSAIDFEDSGLRPFFFDAYSLLIRDPQLRAELESGAFDAELAAVASAGGLRPSDADHRLWSCATALLAAASHARSHGGDLAFTLSRLWPAHDD